MERLLRLSPGGNSDGDLAAAWAKCRVGWLRYDETDDYRACRWLGYGLDLDEWLSQRFCEH